MNKILFNFLIYLLVLIDSSSQRFKPSMAAGYDAGEYFTELLAENLKQGNESDYEKYKLKMDEMILANSANSAVCLRDLGGILGINIRNKLYVVSILHSTWLREGSKSYCELDSFSFSIPIHNNLYWIEPIAGEDDLCVEDNF